MNNKYQIRVGISSSGVMKDSIKGKLLKGSLHKSRFCVPFIEFDNSVKR